MGVVIDEVWWVWLLLEIIACITDVVHVFACT